MDYIIIGRGWHPIPIGQSAEGTPFQLIDPNKIQESFRDLEDNYESMSVTSAGKLSFEFRAVDFNEISDKLGVMLRGRCHRFSNPDVVVEMLQKVLKSKFEDVLEILIAEVQPIAAAKLLSGGLDYVVYTKKDFGPPATRNDDLEFFNVYTSICISIARSVQKPSWVQSLVGSKPTPHLQLTVTHKSGSC